jgi:hypothetical protein
MKLEISAPQLSFGCTVMMSPAFSKRSKRWAEIFPSTKRGRIFGPGTAVVAKALQTDLSVPATGIVDAATVTAINGSLANLANGDARFAAA